MIVKRIIAAAAVAMLAVTSGMADSFDKKFVADVSKKYSVTDTEDLLARIGQVNHDIARKGVVLFVPDGHRLVTGYAYHEMYDWDLYFENIYLSYFGVNEYCFTNLKSFLNIQSINGFVPRTLVDKRPRQHFKPFLAQIAELGSRQTGDYSWLEERADRGEMQIGAAFKNISYYEQLALAIDFWFRHSDFDRNGLPVWNSSDHSGMDNQISRAGALDAFRYEGVDLACYLYRELRAMEIIAERLGKSEDSERFAVRAALLADKINTVFWDERDGFYYDRDEYTGELVKVKSVAGFIPLWCGIAPDRRARRMVDEHLTNPAEFWSDYPVTGYSRTEPDYVQGDIRDWGCNWRGSTWIPTNYMIMRGLINYGFDDVARQLAQKTFDMVYKVNPVTYEFYNGETGKGLGLKQFWGWSALAYFMPFECESGYDPTKLDPSYKIEAIGSRMFGLSFPESGDNIRRISDKLSLENIQY